MSVRYSGRKVSSGNSESAAQEALERAQQDKSHANYGIIIDGFKQKGVTEAEILPRENVLTFRAWLAKGRVVKKGQSGVKIPTVFEVEEVDPVTRVKTKAKHRRTAVVFHVSQTTERARGGGAGAGDSGGAANPPATGAESEALTGRNKPGSGNTGGNTPPPPETPPRAATESTRDATERAERLRAAAAALGPKITHARRPLSQRATHKRLREYNSRMRDGDNMERGQRLLLALASLHEQGKCPPPLANLMHANKAVELVRQYEDGKWVYGDATAVAAQALMAGDREQEMAAAAEARKLEDSVRFAKIDGFFPTPKNLAEEVVWLCRRAGGAGPASEWLEPSAGKGDLAQAIHAACPGWTPKVTMIERNHTLCRILEGKQLGEVHQADVLTCTGEFDCIVMNPPFERGQDAEHVMHCWENLLRPEGCLVAIVSEGPFYRSDKASVAFREWLDTGGKLLSTNKVEDAFAGVDAFRNTKVAVRIIALCK